MAKYDDIDFINLNDIKEQSEVIPDGEYHVKIVGMEVKEKKDKTGHYIAYRSVVQSGEHAGFSIFSMWSLSEKAAGMMKRDFINIGYSPPNGVPHIADLIGFEGIVRVGVSSDKEGKYDDKSTIKKWLGPLS